MAGKEVIPEGFMLGTPDGTWAGAGAGVGPTEAGSAATDDFSAAGFSTGADWISALCPELVPWGTGAPASLPSAGTAVPGVSTWPGTD